MRTYYWQDLPHEIQNDLFVALVEKIKLHPQANELADDYINKRNFPQRLGEWEKTIEEF